MSTENSTAIYRPGINAILHRHEQMSAWLFFTIMSFLVMRFGVSPTSLNMDMRFDYDTNIYYLIGNGWMNGVMPYAELSDLKGPLLFLEHGIGSLLTPGSHCGVALLHCSLLGIWMLYSLKTASLFVRRSTAWALTGILFIYCLYMAAGPAELTMTLQTVSLYHVLVWTRGKKQRFADRHLFIVGLSVAVALLSKFNQVVFWVPVAILMLWVNREHLLRSIGMLIAGFTPLILITVLYFYSTGTLAALWEEYIMTALRYGSVPWAESSFATQHLKLISNIMPEHVRQVIPWGWLVVPGALLLFMWVRPFRKIRRERKRAALLTLWAAFLLGAYANFGGRHAFLHYYFYYYPFALMSLVGMELVLRRRLRNRRTRRILRGVGLMTPFATLLVGLSIPVFVNAFKSGKGVAALRENMSGMKDFLTPHKDDYLLIDSTNYLALYRHTGTIPPIKHFIPQLTPDGEAVFCTELTEHVRNKRPKYLVGNAEDTEKCLSIIRNSGVPYRRLDNCKEAGLPPMPATSNYPAPAIFERID
ncbi:MAG: hypothetical protein Q4A24_02325 [Akkermansia sp.]|nr:hypothetical protein [Akkermansia sp.]